jgi:demethylmenaquinone methyltransferase / 2-methoxy-6-polyprenyl-1,4-benzoquinol methylase
MTERAFDTNAAKFSPDEDDVFARIAGRYDRLCDIFSLGIHRLWKRAIARRMAAHPGATVLDTASGTGDIPLRLMRGFPDKMRGRTLLVTDLCPQMLAIARTKLAPYPTQIAVHDCEQLARIASASVDLYSISFGMKICDRARVTAEALRVLKPGGTFFCLEAARIPVPFVHAAYLRYMEWCLPLIGRIASGGDPSTYGYLLKGVREFPSQRDFAQELREAGFTDVVYRNLTFGIVAIHEATKPA